MDNLDNFNFPLSLMFAVTALDLIRIPNVKNVALEIEFVF